MGYQYWKYDKLDALCNDAFQKFGFNAEEAKIISDVLLMSDRFGIESHGMQRMYRYYKSIQKGMIKIESKGDVVFETSVSAVIDAKDGMGQVVGHKAMEMAIEKAKKSGIGMVVAHPCDERVGRDGAICLGAGNRRSPARCTLYACARHLYSAPSSR